MKGSTILITVAAAAVLLLVANRSRANESIITPPSPTPSVPADPSAQASFDRSIGVLRMIPAGFGRRAFAVTVGLTLVSDTHVRVPRGVRCAGGPISDGSLTCAI